MIVLKNVLFPMNMNTNALIGLPLPKTLSSAATKKYVDDSVNPENIVERESGAYHETILLDSDKN